MILRLMRDAVVSVDRFLDELEEDREVRRGMGRLKVRLMEDGLLAVHDLLRVYLRDEKSAKQATVAEPASSVAEPLYRPEPPKRTVVEGLIVYESMSDEVVKPGDLSTVAFGVVTPVEGTGFPGLPETQHMRFGLAEDFKMEGVHISDEFAVVSGFIGSMNAFALAPGSVVPAAALAPGKPQPEYPAASRGYVISLGVKNVSGKPCAFRGQVVGREVGKVEKVEKGEVQ